MKAIADKDGIAPSASLQAPGKVVVEYPAAYDANVTMTNLKKRISSSSERFPGVERSLQAIQYALDQSAIGRVVAASGIRKNANGRRMDWALVAFTMKMSQETVQSPEALCIDMTKYLLMRYTLRTKHQLSPSLEQ